MKFPFKMVPVQEAFVNFPGGGGGGVGTEIQCWKMKHFPNWGQVHPIFRGEQTVSC